MGKLRAKITEDGACIVVEGSFGAGVIVDRLVAMAQRSATVELTVGANRITFRASKGDDEQEPDPLYTRTRIAAGTFEQALGLLRTACPSQRQAKPKRIKKRRDAGIRGSKLSRRVRRGQRQPHLF